MLNKKIFIISAAADGIGLSITKNIVKHGGKVYLTDIDQKKIESIKSKKEFKNQLYNKNQNSGNAILISEPEHLRRLYEVIILKKILSLNPDLNLNIKSFKAGVEVIFPSTESLIDNELFIDKDIAKYYYEANLYYEAFENEFNKQIKPILNTINLK